MPDSTEEFSTEAGSNSGWGNSDGEYHSDPHFTSSVSRNTKRAPSGFDKPSIFDNPDTSKTYDKPGKTGKLGNLSSQYEFNPASVAPSQVPRTIFGPRPDTDYATLTYNSPPDVTWRGAQTGTVDIKPYEARASQKLDEFDSQFTYGSGDYVHTSPEGYLRSWERATPQSYEEGFEAVSYPADKTVSGNQSQDSLDNRNESDMSFEDSEEQTSRRAK